MKLSFYVIKICARISTFNTSAAVTFSIILKTSLPQRRLLITNSKPRHAVLYSLQLVLTEWVGGCRASPINPIHFDFSSCYCFDKVIIIWVELRCLNVKAIPIDLSAACCWWCEMYFVCSRIRKHRFWWFIRMNEITCNICIMNTWCAYILCMSFMILSLIIFNIGYQQVNFGI